MQTTAKLVLAIAAAFAAQGAFAATNGVSDSDWLMKSPIPSASSSQASEPAPAPAPAPSTNQ